MKSNVILLVGLLFVSGCASKRMKWVNEADWNARVGSYTYEQAVVDLGKPDRETISGEGRNAEWVLKRSPQMSFGVGMGTGSYGRGHGSSVGLGTSVSPPPSGEYLSLTFEEEGPLKEWRRVRY